MTINQAVGAPPGLEGCGLSQLPEGMSKSGAPPTKDQLEQLVSSLHTFSKQLSEGEECCASVHAVAAAIVAVMRSNIDMDVVQRIGSSALESLAAGVVKHQVQLFDLGGPQAVLVAMDAHLEDVDLQQAGCKLIQRIAISNGQSQGQVAQLGAARMLLRSMAAHPQNVKIQEAGCRALKELAALNAANQEEIVLLGGIPAVLRAMELHTNAAKLQEVACGVLRNLCACNAEYQAEVAGRNGIQLVLTSMQEHPDSANVQWAGSWALFCICVHNSELQEEVMAYGGVDAALKAMELHRAVPRIQESCCWLLKELADAFTSKMSCQKDGTEVGKLSAVLQAVLRAMEKHPKERKVQTAVHCALRKLQATDAEGWVKSSILGRCGRMGHSATMRALSAIQEE